MRYITPVSKASAAGAVREVYRQIERDFGVLGEPLTLHSPAPSLLAGVWCAFREAILAGSVRRDLKEAVAIAVSRLNACPYCVDAHSVMLRACASHDAAVAIRRGRGEEIADPAVRDAVAWASAVAPRGSVPHGQRPFSREEAPEVLGTALWVHYINRVVTVFLGGRLIPFSPRAAGLRALAERLGGRYFARTVRRRLIRGESLSLLADSGVRGEPTWAAPSPVVAAAFGGFARAVDAAGSAALGSEVRAWVIAELAQWGGDDPGISGARLDDRLRQLPARLHPEGRLALLTSMAPYRVDDQVVGDYRSRHPADAALLGAVAWSAFAAAERVAPRL